MFQLCSRYITSSPPVCTQVSWRLQISGPCTPCTKCWWYETPSCVPSILGPLCEKVVLGWENRWAFGSFRYQHAFGPDWKCPWASCNKLWLWVLKIPLPYVPPLILAVMPLASSTDAATLTSMEQQLIEVLIGSENPLCIISLGLDGRILECEACWALVWGGFAEYITYSIPHPEGPHLENMCVQVLCVFGQYIAIIQDPKHSHKTGCNKLFSCAWLLVLENNTVMSQWGCSA